MDKLKLAVAETGINQIAIGGGVSANSGIRTTLKEAEKTKRALLSGGRRGRPKKAA
jgi:tRNA A37 threonylcarbamoyltransferase TsaD